MTDPTKTIEELKKIEAEVAKNPDVESSAQQALNYVVGLIERGVDLLNLPPAVQSMFAAVRSMLPRIGKAVEANTKK